MCDGRPDHRSHKVRGWANYHRHVICGETFSKLDSFVWFRLFRWGKRRHPNKSRKWIASRYFGEQDGRQWIFKDKASGKTLIKVSQAIKQQRHIKVKGEADPFDIEWQEYFQHREIKLKMRSVNSYIGKALKRQNGQCPICRQVLEVEEDHLLLHLDGDETNNRMLNVVLLHSNCREFYQSNEIAAT